MKKANFPILLPLILVFILTSCVSLNRNVSSNENNAEPTSSSDRGANLSSIWDESKWGPVTGVVTNYVKLDDINLDGISEIKLGFNAQIFGHTIKETNDGFLFGYITIPEISFVSKYTKNTPKIRKFDKDGSIVWEQEYDYKVYSGKLNSIVVYPDGSFLFSVQTYPYSRDTEMIFEKSFIIKCDKDGKELWKREFDDYSGSLLSNLFLTKKGEIIAVGQWRSKDGRQAKNDGADDIVITKLDSDGNILKQRSFGGADSDSLNTSTYDDNLGIIINGRTQSSDGDFAIDSKRQSSDFIANIDERLNLKWVTHAKDKESFIYDQLALSDGNVYIPGSSTGSDGMVSGFLAKIDKNGNRLWTKLNLYTGFWGRSICILENGDMIVGSGQQNKGVIVVLDKGGTERNRIEDLKFAPNSITPTDNGGFIVTAIREIKTAPQPPIISSIWYDTELVATKYKSDYSIEWRKTYDKYKDKRGEDFALPLKGGKLIIDQ